MTTNRRIPNAESTAFPCWAIICMRGHTQVDHCISVLISAVVGPFLSRESAIEHLEGHRYRYGDNVAVYRMSGHESPDWRALCQEPITQEQKK